MLAIFFVTRVTLAEAYRIPSGSMEPTLLVGDWLFVNKLRFGPHIPFTSLALPGYAQPKRGDVVVFESPPQDSAIRISPDGITPTLVKRIVGIAGDTLVMRDGQLRVNGVASLRPNTDSILPDSIANQPQPSTTPMIRRLASTTSAPLPPSGGVALALGSVDGMTTRGIGVADGPASVGSKAG